MILADTFGQEVGSTPMAPVKPIVLVADDDVWMRESLESLSRDEGWQPETFAHRGQVMQKMKADSVQDLVKNDRETSPKCCQEPFDEF